MNRTTSSFWDIGKTSWGGPFRLKGIDDDVLVRRYLIEDERLFWNSIDWAEDDYDSFLVQLMAKMVKDSMLDVANERLQLEYELAETEENCQFIDWVAAASDGELFDWIAGDVGKTPWKMKFATMKFYNRMGFGDE